MEIDLASHGAPPSASGADHPAHSHPLQRRPLTCTPPAGRIHFNPSGGPHTGYSRPGQSSLTDNGHKGVEVADVEALAGHINEELDHLCSLLLLGWLGRGYPSFSGHVFFPLQTPQSTNLALLLFSEPISQLRRLRPRVSRPFVADAAHSSEVCRVHVAQLSSCGHPCTGGAGWHLWDSTSTRLNQPWALLSVLPLYCFLPEHHAAVKTHFGDRY